MSDAMLQTIHHKTALLKQLMTQTQQRVQDLTTQMAALQAERDQALQVLLRQQGALAGYQELLAEDTTPQLGQALPVDGMAVT